MKTLKILKADSIWNSILFLIIATIFIACTSDTKIRMAAYPELFDGKYDSEFPSRNSSEQLEEISNSIRLVNSIAFYRTFNFLLKDSITTASISSGDFRKFLTSTTTFEETASGTGTLIYNNNNTLAILTCAHVINFPDSIKTFYLTEEGRRTGLLKSFSVIVKQDIYVVPSYEEGTFEVILQDKELDAAILKKKITNEPKIKSKVFNLPLGKAEELSWGTFVYVFGFPANYKMISKAIVSSPNYDKKSSFIIDAVSNQGLSGGIVLAIRDGVPNFELVGMVLSAPAAYEYVLRPHRDSEVVIGSEYKGALIPDAQRNIKYGITKVLSIEAILSLIEKNKTLLQKNDIFTGMLFK